MTEYAYFDSHCGDASAKVVETGADFFEAIYNLVAENQEIIKKSMVKLNKLDKRVARFEQKNHTATSESQSTYTATPRGRRKDIIFNPDTNEEDLINAIKEYLHVKRIDNNERDLVKYVIPTPRFAVFLYQILDRRGLIAHGENPSMKYSAYGRFLQQCTGLSYKPARQNYVRMMNCYNSFCCGGKEIKLYELDVCNVPPGFKYRTEVVLLKTQFDYLEAQLSILPFFKKSVEK